jgi:arsenate reductase
VLRTKEKQFKELAFTAETPENKIIDAIVANPGLLNRPIVMVGDTAVIARPIEKAMELL